MAKSFNDLKAAYEGDIPLPDKWQLGPLIPGSYVRDTMPTQLIDAPGHPAKIEIHGDYCDTLGRQIVEVMQRLDDGSK